MSESIRIVVPSRHRPYNVPKISALLPGCTILVHENERATYAEACDDPKRIATHPDVRSIGDVRSIILDLFDEECIVMIDDDLKGIVPLLARRPRRIIDPRIIRQVIGNSHACAQDLGIGIFNWSVSQNPIGKDFEGSPLRMVGPIASSYGIRGAARRRRFDPQLVMCEDVDFVYQALLHDRVMLQDMRWHFDHGPLLGGVGGNSGHLTDEKAERSDAIVRQRWGRWIGEGGGVNGTKYKRTFSVAVPRRNPSAVRI